LDSHGKLRCAGWRALASGGGAGRQSFRSKWVRAFSNKGHQGGPSPEEVWSFWTLKRF